MKSKNPISSGVTKKRVLIVDDHPIVRQGLAKLINDQPDLVTAGEAESPPAAVRAVTDLNPDLVILDLTLADGDGLELCKQLHDMHPDLPILIVSMHEESLYAERALRAGAMGYVMKQEPQDKVISAIRRVLGGDVYLSEAMAAKLLRGFKGTRADDDRSPLQRLSDRELQIFRLIGEGRSVKDIADTLFLSPKTVETHKEHIKQKLDLKTSNDLLRYAIEARKS
jgi:DNA-binding NarL/FixJ family response regulator